MTSCHCGVKWVNRNTLGNHEVFVKIFYEHSIRLHKDMSERHIIKRYATNFLTRRHAYPVEFDLYFYNTLFTRLSELRNMATVSALARPAPIAIFLAMSLLTRSSGE
jgi:hypothetical protein